MHALLCHFQKSASEVTAWRVLLGQVVWNPHNEDWLYALTPDSPSIDAYNFSHCQVGFSATPSFLLLPILQEERLFRTSEPELTSGPCYAESAHYSFNPAGRALRVLHCQ